ncbi:LysR family transcriptional regulator [Peribacillus psychrosaccharolyticus]|uniref:LysR family transcriptional regulator n=2 Tax=Peribacillus psychrosaccharolyticus TaxID=1407 RepID=A0A974NN54_PERPY|nr:LysR family transcriptional regulator [Peribacillus psychrosaccharolyticus]MEC2056078.1 LysR family transcriptional regulator [Peribacillus psychrosaccharolyticus]MED3745519.1 LysR family transcriptional regulator [Peribacillus psychrosaccharolyticus]QQT00727.1 LysR family transcriptional regulator [Peribacillus psychrosaccharolyticus]
MNFEQLQYVKVVVECKSITIAAQQLFVTQSAISQSITSLEKELNVVLFHRSRHGTIPTEDGLWLLPKLMEVFQKTQEITLEIESRTSQFAGEVKIATIPSLFMTLLPETLATFKKDYPLVNYQILELENNKVIEAVQQKKADIGFIALTHDLSHFDTSIYFQHLQVTSQYYLLVSASSRFALHEEITLEEVLEEPFILYGEHFYPNLIRNFSTKSNEQTILFQSYNSEVIKKSVMAGLGVSILTNLMIEEDPYILDGRMKAIKLIGYPFQMPLSYSLIYHQDLRKSPLIQKLAAYFD